MDSDIYLYLNGIWEAQEVLDALKSIEKPGSILQGVMVRLSYEIAKKEQADEE